jgi:hypothetical protein
MNLNFGINPPQSKEAESLYKLAYYCVHAHTTVGCNACSFCTYNVERYGYDPNQARLIKARASLEYAEAVTNRVAAKKAWWKAELAVIICVIFLVLFTFVGISFIGAQEKRQTLEEAAAWVRANVRVVNYDDLINCIDYAVVFYEVWPDSQIIRAYDAAGTFNHLLNKVGDRYIEPQAYNVDPMTLWPTNWPTAYKIDQTHVWGWWGNRKKW